MNTGDQRRWRLRPISAADFEWAFTLHRDAMGEYIDRTWGWEEAEQRHRFSERFKQRPRQVIEVDGEPVGILEVHDRPDELYLALIELSPKWQSRGLGAEIMGWLREWATQSNKRLSLHVLQVNRRAVEFYEREGLHVVDTEPPKVMMRTI